MKAVVFDMDGVLVDSQLHWEEVEESFLASLIPGWNLKDQSKIIGMSINDVHLYLSEHYKLKASLSEMLKYYNELAETIYCKQSNLLPGVIDCLDYLKAKDLKLAVASSSPKSWIKMTVDNFNLSKFFSHQFSSEDVGNRGKPHPDIYQLASETLKVSPKDSLAIEDSNKGVQSAKACGMKCIGLRNGFNEKQDLTQADLIIDGFSVQAIKQAISI